MNIVLNDLCHYKIQYYTLHFSHVFIIDLVQSTWSFNYIYHYILTM